MYGVYDLSTSEAAATPLQLEPGAPQTRLDQGVTHGLCVAAPAESEATTLIVCGCPANIPYT